MLVLKERGDIMAKFWSPLTPNHVNGNTHFLNKRLVKVSSYFRANRNSKRR